MQIISRETNQRLVISKVFDVQLQSTAKARAEYQHPKISKAFIFAILKKLKQ
jgi:hypothetical protein